MAILTGVSFDSFLAAAKKTKLGKTKTTTAPQSAPEYRIIFPIEGIKMANRMHMTMTAELIK